MLIVSVRELSHQKTINYIYHDTRFLALGISFRTILLQYCNFSHESAKRAAEALQKLVQLSLTTPALTGCVERLNLKKETNLTDTA